MAPKQIKYKCCKNCKHIYKDKNQCPLCKSSQSSNIWRGEIFVFDQTKSQIASKLGYNDNGRFALKVK